MLKTFESILTADMSRAIEILRRHERVREPPNVTTPDDVILREGERSAEEIFTGEDAIKYITNLAILRSKRKERESREGERERREKEDIERRLREEIVRVENDGSLEEFLKRKREQEGENEFEKKVHYQPNQLDITPLMQQVSCDLSTSFFSSLSPSLPSPSPSVPLSLCPSLSLPLSLSPSLKGRQSYPG